MKGRIANCRANALSELESVLLITTGENKGKLLTAIAAQGVARSPCCVFEALSQRHQNLVADHVPILIIHRFKVVDVEHNQRQWLLVAPGATKFQSELAIKMAAVKQASQSVFTVFAF